MNALSKTLGGVAGLAALWAGGWYAGKAFFVEPEADRVVEELRAGNLFFSYETREVGGFPTGYDVAYQGVEISNGEGWRWSAPRTTIAAGVANIGALTVTPSDESKLTVNAAAFGGGADDAPVAMDIASEGLVLTLSENGERVDVDAAKLTATQAADGALLKGAVLDFAALDAGGRIAGDRSSADLEMVSEAARIAYRISVDGVTESRSDTQLKDFKAFFEGTELNAENFADFITRGGEGRFSMSVGAYEGEGGATGGPSAAPMDMTMAGDGASAEIAFADGRAVYRATAGRMSYKVALEAPPPFSGGELEIAGAEAALEFPVAKSGAAAPYAMAIRLDGVALGEDLWATFDPAKGIDRTPIDVNLDVGGDARVIFNIGDESFGQAPLDVETMEIRDLSLTGLGVSAVATGDLKIAGDASRPDGEVHFELRGAFALIDNLASAGLLPREQGEFFKALALGLAKQGDGPDHLIADIEAQNGEITVNGQRVR